VADDLGVVGAEEGLEVALLAAERAVRIEALLHRLLRLGHRLRRRTWPHAPGDERERRDRERGRGSERPREAAARREARPRRDPVRDRRRDRDQLAVPDQEARDRVDADVVAGRPRRLARRLEDDLHRRCVLRVRRRLVADRVEAEVRLRVGDRLAVHRHPGDPRRRKRLQPRGERADDRAEASLGVPPGGRLGAVPRLHDEVGARHVEERDPAEHLPAVAEQQGAAQERAGLRRRDDLAGAGERAARPFPQRAVALRCAPVRPAQLGAEQALRAGRRGRGEGDQDRCEQSLLHVDLLRGILLPYPAGGLKPHGYGSPVLDPRIFKAYDVRGIYPTELDEEGAYAIGRAYVEQFSPSAIAVGRDMRLSGESMARAVREGAADAGAVVLDLGMVGTEMLYFAVGELGLDGGIAVTASHNPKEYTGMKIVRGGALPVGGESGLLDVRDLSFVDVGALRPLRVVIDAANGMAGAMLPPVLERLPMLDVVRCYFEP